MVCELKSGVNTCEKYLEIILSFDPVKHKNPLLMNDSQSQPILKHDIISNILNRALICWQVSSNVCHHVMICQHVQTSVCEMQDPYTTYIYYIYGVPANISQGAQWKKKKKFKRRCARYDFKTYGAQSSGPSRLNTIGFIIVSLCPFNLIIFFFQWTAWLTLAGTHGIQ